MRKKAERRAALNEREAEILEDILDGLGYRAIATKYGVGLGTLARWIDEDPERSQACARAREQSADQCDEEAAKLIQEAADPFELAKARELAVHLRWRAKARNPRSYGDRQQVQHSGTLSLEQMVRDSYNAGDGDAEKQ